MGNWTVKGSVTQISS